MIHSLRKRAICACIVCFSLISTVAFAEDGEIDFEGLMKRDWVAIETPNFSILSNQSEKSARGTAELLEYFATFTRLLMSSKADENDKKSKFLLTANDQTWRDLGLEKSTIAVFTEVNGEQYAVINLQSGFGSTFKRVSSERADLLSVVAQQQLRNNKAGFKLPAWYQIGASFYLGSVVESRGKLVLGQLEAVQGRLYSLLNSGGSLKGFNSKSVFEAVRRPSREDFVNNYQFLDATNEFYSTAFIAMHYFQSSSENRERLNRFVNLMGMGATPEAALNGAFNITYDAFDKELQKYARGSLYARAFEKDQVDKLIASDNPALASEIALMSIASVDAMTIYADFLAKMELSNVASDSRKAFIEQLRSALVAQGKTLISDDFKDL